MRNLILILLVFSSSLAGNAQRKQAVDIAKETKKIKSLLDAYSKLSPFVEDEKRFDKIESIQIELDSRLLKILGDKKIAKYDLEKTLKHDELSVAKSEDDRLYFLAIDQKTGGTFQAQTVYIHFRNFDGSVFASKFAAESADGERNFENMPFYQIFTLDASAGKYIAIGGVATCSTCYANAALVVTIAGNEYQTEELALFDGRYDELLNFEYHPQDKTFDCEYNSGHNDDPLYGGDNETEGFQHRYKAKYQFVNGRFITLEKSEFWDKIETHD